MRILASSSRALVTPDDSYNVTTFLQGDANRYFRANEVGVFLQDKFQIKPNLTLTGGICYDWDGGMSEKYGRMFNFDPSLYSSFLNWSASQR